ncbi:MAG: nitrate reductase molybdenum cofactor assembly chaperone [Actinomycetia bacterium]|nr:nitrate reductase molybdenum cofactor assembly chaperone [Actinomycetes bacterium]
MRAPLVRPRAAGVPRREMDDLVVRATWQLVSLLLGYPDEALYGRLPALRQAAEVLPEPVGPALTGLVDHLDEVGLGAAQRRYVETFDYTRRCALHLTYYTHGDSRKRGVALVELKQAYRRVGWDLNGTELPDHLSVLLELGAVGDLDLAWELLNRHRVGVELLALALADRGSGWLPAVRALQATLPALDGDQAELVARLLRDGPEAEDVGLEPYGIDPALSPHPHDDADLLGV